MSSSNPKPKRKLSPSPSAPPPFTAEALEIQKPNPRYSSYVTRNAAVIESRTTNNNFQMLQTEGDDAISGSKRSRSTDLKKGDNEDLLRILGPDYSDQFKSPYDTVDIIRFHECIRDDGIVAASLDFIIQFMLGDHFKTIIDVNAEFDTEEDEKAARDAFNANKQIRGYKQRLDQINRELKFQTQLFSLLLQCMVFGRACGLIERSDVDGLPISVKILPSMHLGQVYVHRKTWNVIGVEHKDFKFPASILKSEDVVYFTVRNHHISPGTLHYGYSLLERVVDLSELNRITNQRNLKEINYRLWAAFLLIKIPGSYNRDLMKKTKDEIAKGAGNSIVVNQAMEVEVHQIGHDMEKLLDQRDKNYREMIRQLQVPIILFDPDILNRATSQELMEAWHASVLTVLRSWLKDVIQDQWINPILKTMIENEREAARTLEPEEQVGIGRNTTETEPEPEPKQIEDEQTNEGKNPNRVKAITKEVIPIEAIDPRTGEVLIYRLNWKIKAEFDPPNFDTFKEKAETSILLKNNGLSTIGAALRRIGIDDENEIAALLDMEEKRQALRFQQGLPQAETGPAPVGEAQAQQTGGGRAPRSIERQKEKFKESLRKSVTGQNVPSQGIIRPKRKPPDQL